MQDQGQTWCVLCMELPGMHAACVAGLHNRMAMPMQDLGGDVRDMLGLGGLGLGLDLDDEFEDGSGLDISDDELSLASEELEEEPQGMGGVRPWRFDFARVVGHDALRSHSFLWCLHPDSSFGEQTLSSEAFCTAHRA